MNAVRGRRPRGASIIIHRQKPGVRLLRRRVSRQRGSLIRRGHESAWAGAMLNLRTATWLSRRLSRLYFDEAASRFRRQVRYARR
jgi:hypothetical protein